jgi:hypothetical protein
VRHVGLKLTHDCERALVLVAFEGTLAARQIVLVRLATRRRE